MWSAYDFSEVEPHCEKFAIRVPKEDYDRFYREYEKAVDWNHQIPPVATEADRDRLIETQAKERNEERERKRKE